MWNRFRIYSLALFLLFLSVVAVHAGESGFVFSVPQGWLNLADIDSKYLSAEFRRIKESGIYSILAVDPEDPKHAAMNAIIKQERIEVTEGMLQTVAETMRQEILEHPAMKEVEQKTGMGVTGFDFKLKSSELLRYGDVTVGRMVAAITVNSVSTMQVIYYLPGENSYAVLTFATTAAKFPWYEKVFDDVARNVKGVANPKTSMVNWNRIMGKAAGAGLLAAIAGAILVFSTWMQNRKADKKENN